MRLLIGIILVLFGAVGLSLILKDDPGYALLTIGELTIETSVAFLVIFLVILFILLYILVRFLVKLWRAPRYAREATQRRRRRRSLRLLARGIQELAEGRWEAAEAHLIKGAPNSENPTVHYLSAANAAQRLHADWRRNRYLKEAEQQPSRNALAVKLTKAKLYLEDGQPAEAKPLLVDLRSRFPKNTEVLKVLMEIHRALGEWEPLRELLPELQRHKALDDAQLAKAQIQVHRELLDKTGRSGGLPELRAAWKRVPKSLRLEEELVIVYGGHLQDHDAAKEAESLFRDALARQWSDKLVVGYGQITRGDAATQLAVAENWLKAHDTNPHLLLTLGRLSKRSRQWAKARAYLERSIRALPTPDAFYELGEVLEQMDDKEGANRCYRTGLRLVSGQAPDDRDMAVLPAAEGKALTAAQPADKTAIVAKEDPKAPAPAVPPKGDLKPGQAAT